ncbi:MAG: hypothetical protein GTO67_12925 [Gammaproteobacteria bacterium]|nr:hypothetical protein [Gammaproteobacteria bacterium]NIM74883.1 hypothetical protein [Gammaproteobacteria bacterium]NIN39475.1 hypothetical protein [Gammaproteobacteria bacterium]NIO26801.1 hypothetical protein [Gammaproteobacteria bacterium]NIO67357.1 hypothetical protein [Gammaproteobacteria bacterium]
MFSVYRFHITAVVALFAIVSACAGPSKEAYIGYLGPERPESEIATLRLGDAEWAKIDSLDTPYRDFHVSHHMYGEIKLMAGEYHIEWGRVFGFSPLVNPAMSAEYKHDEAISLTDGHSYTLHAQRTYGRGYRVFFWVEDNTTGRVVAGTKKS